MGSTIYELLIALVGIGLAFAALGLLAVLCSVLTFIGCWLWTFWKIKRAARRAKNNAHLP